jgi:aminotransferase
LDAILHLKQIFKHNSNQIFLIDDINHNKLTFREIEIESSKIASNLIDLGLRQGDKVGIIMENSASLVKLYFACLFCGIVVIPINHNMSSQEIEHIINHSKMKFVFVDTTTNSKINNNFLNSKKISKLLIKKSDKSIIESNLIVLNFDKISLIGNFKPFQNISSNDDMIIIYTSGTTAKPKAVIHKISDIVKNALVFGKELEIGKDNRFYNILSLSYLGGYYNLLLLPFVLGSSVVLTNTFNPKSALNFWESIIKHNVNTLWLVPSIMSILMEIDRSADGENYCKNNIKKILTGTAPLSIQLRKEFEKKYDVKVFENYGLSETFFISTNSQKHPVKDGSVGKILEGVKIKIVDKYGKEVEEGNEGEVIVKTIFLMKGYYNLGNNNKLKKFFTHDWFKTGDIGILKKSTLYITGRKKDMIIRGGVNISPVSIENIFYKHPKVIECAIIGIPHKIQGEEIILVIRIKNEEDFEKIKKELSYISKIKLEKIKQPSKILFLTEFPHSTYGKIKKNKIRSWALQQNSPRKPNRKTIKINQDYKISPSKIVSESIEAISIKYNTLVYEKQRNKEDVIVMSLGEAFFEIPLFSFDELPTKKIYHYSNSKGIPELRKKLAKYFFDTYDVTFNYEKEILITAGSKIAIYMCLMTMINPGDEVIIYEPAWVSYPEQVKLCQGIPIQIPYYKTVYDFESFISKKTKMIIINNPNNPTGKVYSLDELTHIHELAKKYQIYILSDEAYSDFVLNQDEFISFAHLDIKKEHSIIVNSISKNFGISGWRLGYIISNSELIEQILKLNQHLITCAPTILQYYVAHHYEKIINITKPQIKELGKKRQKIKKYMESIDLQNLQGNTTFYFFTSIADSKLNSDEFCSVLLKDYHVSSVPGIGYGKSCNKFIRISIGSENMERIKIGLKAIKNLISKTLN